MKINPRAQFYVLVDNVWKLKIHMTKVTIIAL